VSRHSGNLAWACIIAAPPNVIPGKKEALVAAATTATTANLRLRAPIFFSYPKTHCLRLLFWAFLFYFFIIIENRYRRAPNEFMP
jgi:hypothetical protein